MVYTFMNLGAFMVLIALRRKGVIGEDMDDIAGLAHKSPGYALLMLIFLLSLAGIPPTAGFWGKYYIFLALIETHHYTLAVIATLYVAVAIITTSASYAAYSSGMLPNRRPSPPAWACAWRWP